MAFIPHFLIPHRQAEKLELEEEANKESESTLAHLKDNEGAGDEEGGAPTAPHRVLRIDEKRAVVVMSSNCLIKMASPEVCLRRLMNEWSSAALPSAGIHSVGYTVHCPLVLCLHISPGALVQVYPMFGYDKSNELRGRNVSTLIPVSVQG